MSVPLLHMCSSGRGMPYTGVTKPCG